MEAPTQRPASASPSAAAPAQPSPGAPGAAPAPPFLRSLPEITADLKKPIPARLLSTKKVPTKKGPGYQATYCHHATLRDLLDHYAPGWSWSVRLHNDTAGHLYVVGTLTLHGSDGTVSRDGLGNEDSDLDGYGDPSSNAEAQALRRAAMAHGLGRDLWRKHA